MREFCLRSFIFVSLVTLIVACNGGRVYDKWIDIDEYTWVHDSVFVFEYIIEDTSIMYDVNLGLRHVNQYPYQNIWMLTSMQSPNGVVYKDTIQCQLANEFGEWYGKRGAGIYNYVLKMYSGVKFADVGTYNICIQHGMRENNLNGVAAVGIKIDQKH